MENLVDFEVRNLVNELTKGKEMANQLQIHLHAPTSSHEIREILVNKIIDSYDKMLSMVKHDGYVGEKESPSMAVVATIGGNSESPRSLSGSPRSQDSDMELKDHDRNEASRKRKAMPRWTKHVQIYPSMGPEGSLEDGYSWRKYGQKEILGAKYPRGYYRCTHRKTQSCLATKQVQRSDDNPTIFEVTYRGKHTCNQIINSLKSTSTSSTTMPAEKQESNIKNEDQNHQKLVSDQPDHLHNQLALLSNYRSNLKVLTENLDTQNQLFPADSFNFPSSSVISHENFPFSPNFPLDNNFPSANFPSLIMPPTSDDSNYFLASSSTTTQVENFHHEQKFQTYEQHAIPDMASATTSATNSPTIGLDYTFSTLFSPNFSFDNARFSS